MSDKKRLMLIDGHALAFRAYHAIPPLTSPTGEPTNATFGFANMLLKALDDYQPDYVITSFDVGRTFRHEEYEQYKAHRAETPEDLRGQVDRIRELLEALGIPVCTMEGYEADDVLGSLSTKANDAGLETIIVTGDSDVFQLIGPSVRVLVPRRTFGDVALYDEAGIKERYGLSPAQLVDLKALMGDSSDNIPGVSGVGEKTATRLLQEYDTVEQVYAHLDQVSPARYREALEQGRHDAPRQEYSFSKGDEMEDFDGQEYSGHRMSVLKYVKEMESCILNDTTPAVNEIEGAKCIAVCAAADTSLRTGQAVKVCNEF